MLIYVSMGEDEPTDHRECCTIECNASPLYSYLKTSIIVVIDPKST